MKSHFHRSIAQPLATSTKSSAALSSRPCGPSNKEHIFRPTAGLSDGPEASRRAGTARSAGHWRRPPSWRAWSPCAWCRSPSWRCAPTASGDGGKRFGANWWGLGRLKRWGLGGVARLLRWDPILSVLKGKAILGVRPKKTPRSRISCDMQTSQSPKVTILQHPPYQDVAWVQMQNLHMPPPSPPSCAMAFLWFTRYLFGDRSEVTGLLGLHGVPSSRSGSTHWSSRKFCRTSPNANLITGGRALAVQSITTRGSKILRWAGGLPIFPLEGVSRVGGLDWR